MVPEWWIVDARENGDKGAFAASADAGLLPKASCKNCFWVSELPNHTAIMGLGKYGQMLYVNQEAGVVIAKFSSQSPPSDDALDDAQLRRLRRLGAAAGALVEKCAVEKEVEVTGTTTAAETAPLRDGD